MTLKERKDWLNLQINTCTQRHCEPPHIFDMPDGTRMIYVGLIADWEDLPNFVKHWEELEKE